MANHVLMRGSAYNLRVWKKSSSVAVGDMDHTSRTIPVLLWTKKAMPIDRRIPEASGIRQLFHHQWTYILKLLDEWYTSGSEARNQKAEIANAVESAVAGTNSRMRIVGNYKNKLRDSIRQLLSHIEELGGNLPGPIAVSGPAFQTNPHLNAFFVNKKHLREVFGNSHALQDFFSSPEGLEEQIAYAQLMMIKKEKSVLGVGPSNGMIVRYLRQTGVHFPTHKVLSPCANEDALRKSVKRYLFDSVVSYIKSNISQLDVQDIESGATTSKDHDLKNPLNYLNKLIILFNKPNDLITIDRSVLKVSKIGIKLDKESNEVANELTLHEMGIGKGAVKVVILVTYPRYAMGT